MGLTNIAWCDYTKNFWIGCTKRSAECAFCYAERENDRFNWSPEGWGKGKQRKLCAESGIAQVRTWNRKATQGLLDRTLSKPPLVFSQSLADIFDEEVPREWLLQALTVIAECDSLHWMLLTKRPEYIWPFILECGKMADPNSLVGEMLQNWIDGGYPAHISLGISCGDQPTANERLDKLLKVQAANHFVSAEPLLSRILLPIHWMVRNDIGAKIDYLITGGESGEIPAGRPCDPDNYRMLRDTCQYYGTRFMFKQWGEWAPLESIADEQARGFCTAGKVETKTFEGGTVYRVGRKLAGHKLDGKEHLTRII